jgi:hypothetical protein
MVAKICEPIKEEKTGEKISKEIKDVLWSEDIVKFIKPSY